MMRKPVVAVTGKNGQLGTEIKLLSAKCADTFDFVFVGRDDLDIADAGKISSFFAQYQPSYFIHCAAYTAVDKAETEQETALLINAEATGNIARQCKLNNCVLIFISTDYVFDGTATQPYKPEDETNPVNYYGYTKWMGEKLALENNPQTIIIRTSWVYSSSGNNFVKTMLRLMKERDVISVINDQRGAPTYAADLGGAILDVIQQFKSGKHHFGIYQYSNKGNITWYDFAVAIKEMASLSCDIKPIPTKEYPTPAKRPAYSLMDTSAIVNDFGVDIKDWKESLASCIRLINQ